MRTFLSNKRGQGLLEYALIISFIGMVVIGALQMLGASGNNSLANAATSFSFQSQPSNNSNSGNNSNSDDDNHNHDHER
jgi:Flp pilus assembly pilin Flp